MYPRPLLLKNVRTMPTERHNLKRYVGEHTYVLLSELISPDRDWSAALVFEAIADGTLFCDLTQGDLSKPSTCKVYPDRLTCEIHSLAGEFHIPGRRMTITDLKVGDKLTWNSGLYEIKAILEDVFELLGPSNEPLRLPIKRLTALLESDIEIVHCSHMPTDQAYVLPPLTHDRKRQLVDDLKVVRDALIANTPPPASRSRLRKLYFKAKRMGGLQSNLVQIVTPKTYLRGNRDAKAPANSKELALEILRKYRTAETPDTIASCWNTYVLECTKRQIQRISKTTFYKLDVFVPASEKARALRGNKASYQLESRIGAHRANSMLEPKGAWQIAGIDTTPLDFMIYDEQYGFIYKTKSCVRLTDKYSRIPLSVSVSLSSASAMTSMALVLNCIRRHNRVPTIIQYDKGSEFVNTDFEVLCGALDITIIERRASQPRDDATTERQHLDFDERFIQFLSGNTRQLKNPRGLDPQKNPENLAIWTPRAFVEEVENYSYQLFPRLFHQGINTTPAELFEYSCALQGKPNASAILLDEQTLAGILPSTRPRQLLADPRRGCQCRGVRYWHPLFENANVANRKFSCHRMPFDISFIWMFVGKRWIKCISDRHSELLGMSEVEADLISQTYGLNKAAGRNGSYWNALILANNRERIREREEALWEIRGAEISRMLLYPDYMHRQITMSPVEDGTTRQTDLLERARQNRREISSVDESK